MSASPLRAALGDAWHGTRARVRGSAIVLTYHRVGETADDPHRLTVSAQHFAEQMEVVAREHETLTAGELAALMRAGKRLPQRAVVVTFDDGYAETHAVAGPILARLGVRATSFLCSDAIGMRGEYPWDAENGPAAPGAAVAPEAPAPLARASRRVLSSDEVRALHAGGAFEFAAHTRTHPCLSELGEAAQRDEIAGSKIALEALLGVEPRAFSYPHGGAGDFDATSVRLAREAGFDAAFTTLPGIVVPWAERFTVPRYHTEDVSGDAFRNLLNGWFDAAR